jgi:hypothetical protein
VVIFLIVLVLEMSRGGLGLLLSGQKLVVGLDSAALGQTQDPAKPFHFLVLAEKAGTL